MAGSYIGLLHSHGAFWIITIILFFLTVIFIRNGKEKASKIMSMVLRLFYVLLLVTGILLIITNDFSLYTNQFHWESYVKGILAFWLIYIMEMITTKMKKGQLDSKSARNFWIQFIVALGLTLYFGYFLI